MYLIAHYRNICHVIMISTVTTTTFYSSSTMAPRMRRRITHARREEIEKEQRLLDKTIVRPFDTLEGLPLSYSEPPNGHFEEVLKNPLTIKDSAVLYNSLIRSRNTYVYHAPMFRLYWVKQTAYAKKLAEMEKDKDRGDSKRRFAKATSNALEAKSRAPVLSGDVNARDVMSKLCEASFSLGPHTMDVRIFIAKDARSEKSKAFAEISRVSDPDVVSMTNSPGYIAPGTPVYSPGPAALGPQGPVAAPVTAPTPVSSAPPLSPDTAPVSQSEATTLAPKPSDDKKEETLNSESAPAETDEQNTHQDAKEVSPVTAPLSSDVPKLDSTVPESTLDSTVPDPTLQPPAPQTEAPRPPPPVAANLQSIANTIMISNLNAIAKIDLSLNDLMKVVALGSASETQITLFKKYIERAKQMGPQPHHADLYYSRNLPLPPNFPRPYSTKQFVQPRIVKTRLPNLPKLTAFQEKYLHNATLVFEFLENPNVRYVIPRDSICEVLDLDKPPTLLDDGTEVRDVLLSHLWVHNIDEVDIYERDLAKYNAEVKKREAEEEQKRKEEEEEEKKKAAEEEKPSEEGADAPATTEVKVEESDGLRALRGGVKKRPPPPKKKVKTLDAPIEPQIRYTAFSFTLHNIPEKFVPIVLNSMRPLKQVQERMERILKVGNRVASFHLWYQLEAKLDERLAESLRRCLVEEEKKMPGVPPQGVETKKRKPRELKNPKPKKSRDGTPPLENFTSGYSAPSYQQQPIKLE